MKQAYLDPHELIWLKRWLRSNLTVASLIVLVLILVQNAPGFPVAPGLPAKADGSNRSREVAHDSRADLQTTLPRETKLVLLDSRKPNPVEPQGWRRTVNGWEHVSTWNAFEGPSINEWIDVQQEREPAWVRSTFIAILRTSPLMIALLQITVVATIVHVARSRPSQALPVS